MRFTLVAVRFPLVKDKMTPGRHQAISEKFASNKGLIGRVAAVVLVVAALISIPIAVGVSPLNTSVSVPVAEPKTYTPTATQTPDDQVSVAPTPAPSASDPQEVVTPAVVKKPKVPKPKKVERKLRQLGLPIGTVDKHFDSYSTRAFCAWRELTGRKVSHRSLSKNEKRAIMTTSMFLIPNTMVNGMNVNQTCQVNYWIDKNKAGYRTVRGVFPVSSGQNGWTPNGNYSISHQIDGWHESTQFEGAMMYRPKYFNGGIALHGSISDSLVLPWPASHGCVRMLHKDIDTLWKQGVNPGTPVQVYGSYF